MRLSSNPSIKNKPGSLFSRNKINTSRVVLSLLIALTAALATSLIVRAVANLSATMTDAIIDDGIALSEAADGKADPGETIEYTTVITNSGADPATGVTFTDMIDANTTLVGGSLNVSPLAINDSYETIGNTLLDVGVGAANPAVHVSGNLFDNDVEFLAEAGTFNITSHTNPANGTLPTFNNATGTFTYLPNANFTGTDTFTYTLTDAGGLTDTSTVTITVTQRVWYVKNDATAGGTGRSTDPFDTLVEAQTASSVNDTIFIYFGNGTTSGQNAGIVLKNGQRLLGQGVALTVPVSVNGGSNPTTLLAAGTKPLVGNSAGIGVSAPDINNVQIFGLNIAGNTNAVNVTTTSTNSGSFELADNIISAAGTNGIDINGGGSGTLTVSLHDNTVTATANGIDIVRTDGNIAITAFDDNTVSGDTGGTGINIIGSNITFDATPGSAFQTVSGGTTTIGTSGNPVGAAGMVLSTVSGDLSFTDLDIFASSGNGLSASGVAPYTSSTGLQIAVTPASPDDSGTSTINNVNGSALDISLATVDLRLSNLTSTTTASGFSLTNVAGQVRVPSTGSITKTTGTGTAFSVASSDATVNYLGSLNITSGAGVSLTSNTGTITFAGGMILSTGVNAAFTATGGGTVNVCDENPCNSASTGSLVNTLTTTTGTALNVVNTTIGPGNLEFRSISANGASNGIVLNTTGNSGGLTVSGTGSSGSGGTIQNITNRGASFVSAVNISLSWMNFTNANTADGATSDGVVGGNENTDENAAIHLQNLTQVDLVNININGTVQHGINGNNVTDLDISNTTIQNAGDEVWESSIYIFDLKGLASASRTSVFNNLNIVNDSGQFNIAILNDDGTNDRPAEKDRLEITNSQFTRNGSNALISDNVTIFNSGTGNFQVVVSTSTFTSTATCGSPAFTGACVSDNIQVDAGNNAAFDADISNGNTFTSGNAGQSAVNISASGAGQGTFNVSNITTTVRASQGINVALTTTNPTASLRGTIANNNISTSVANNAGSGINMVLEGAGTMVVNVNNNLINGNGTNDFDYGIRGGARAGSGAAHFQITNNSVPSAEVAGVWFFAGNATAGESSLTCTNFVSNLIDGHPTASFTDYFVEMYTGTTFQIQGLSGNAGSYIASTDADPNPADPTVDYTSGTAINYTNGVCSTQFSMSPDNNQVLAQNQPSNDHSVSQSGQVSAIINDATINADLNSVHNSISAIASANLSKQISAINSQSALISTTNIGGSGKPLFLPAQFGPLQSGETVTVPAFTLPAGKSVTIKFQVKVNDPITVGTIKISNQATIKSNELADVLTTDPSPNADPACTGSGTKTCTPVDRPNTTISSIDRAASSPTNASSVSWTVTFADPVSNLTSSNFALATTGGVSGASITSVSAVGSAPDDQWTVTANTGSGDGTLGLNMANDTGASHDITVLPFTGEVYTLDLTPPTVTINQKSTAPAQADPAGSSPINFTVIFSEAVTDFDDAADVSLTGSAGATTAVITGGPTTYNVAVSGMTSDGTVIASIPAGVATDGVNTNDASTSTDNTVLYDTNPPTVTIDQAAGQDDPTNGSTIHFTVEFNEDVTGFNNGDVTLTSPFSLSQNITGGPRTYDVAVTGMSGSGTIVATVNSSVALDLASQPNDASTSTDNEVTFDDIAPDTTITGNPANPTNSTSGTFTFSGTDPETGIDGFECNLDSGGFNTCNSGVSFTSLSDGSHTLQVRAIDNAGNADATPASYTWVVDATSPDTTITATPSNPTNSTSATFNFNGNDASGTGVASFECKLDGSSFAACTDPASYTGLSEGSHTFEVRAIDNVGNVDATPASYTWVIDTTAPGVTITGNPTNPTNSTSATFTFTGDDGTGSGVSGFECKLDSGSFGTCVSGVNYTSLSAGSHTFEVRAIDTANNVGTLSDTYTWVIDLTAPTVTINQASGQSDPTNNNSINFTAVFSEPVTGFIGADVSLSGTASPTSAVVTESAPNDGTTYNVAVSGMTSGGTVIATIPVNVVQDLATNNNAASTSTDNTVTFTVDTTTTITSDTPEPSIVGQAVTVNFTVTAALGTPTGNVTITDSASAATCTGTVAAGSCNITLTSSGVHTLTATYGTSGTFNGSSDTESHSVSVTLTVNTFADDLTTNGNCSLREAVRAANTNLAVDTCPAGSASIVDVITLASGTYTISRSGADDTAMNGDLDITGNTRIVGAGAASTFISGGSLDRVFHILSGTVQIDDLTVKSGSNATGGGIYNAGTLTLNTVTVTANAATTAATGTSHGAGIYNTGTLTLNNSTVSNNTATSGVSGKSRGGGIHNNGGTLTLNSSTVTGNKALSGGLGVSQGGGIYTIGGSTTLNSTTPSGNTVVTGAGGSAAGPNTYP